MQAVAHPSLLASLPSLPAMAQCITSTGGCMRALWFRKRICLWNELARFVAFRKGQSQSQNQSQNDREAFASMLG